MTYYLLKSKQKQAWIDALESGRYTHGRKFLRTPTGLPDVRHCCLGVLAEVQGIEIASNGEALIEDGCYKTFNGRDAWYGSIRTLLGTEHILRLIDINDRTDTTNYSEQIDYIKGIQTND